MSGPQWPNIPNTIFGKNGDDMNQTWKSFFSNTTTELNYHYADQGLLIPSLSDSQIAELDLNSTKNRLFIDETNNLLIINLNGTLKTIQTA